MAGDYQNTGIDWSNPSTYINNNTLGIGSGLLNYFSQQGAAGQLGSAIGSVIPQQQGIMGQVGGYFNPQRGLGNQSFGGLGSFLGLPGYSNFNPKTLNNFPGLNFLTGIGDTAIRNQESAKGDLYTPGTAAYLANYNQGLGVTNALQPYLNTLLSGAGFGAQGNQAMGNAALSTGSNIAQSLIGRGAANASGTAAGATPLNSILQNGAGLLRNYLGGGSNTSGFGNGGMFGGSGMSASSSPFDLFGNSGGFTGAGSTVSPFDIGMNDITSGLGGSLDTGLQNYANSGLSSLGDLFPSAGGQAATAGIGGVAGVGGGAGAGAAGGGAGMFGSGLSGGQLLGAAAIPFTAYNAIKNWQSGNTGSDAMQGAELGASIGSIVPGIGTLIGGLLGGGVGALSSAFGGGRPDPETQGWNNFAKQYQANPNIAGYLNPSQAYQNLAGVMDAKNNSPGHSEPIEQVFGRMGEQNLMDQLTGFINRDVSSGKITPGESVQQQWNSQIYPWLAHQGATINPNQMTSQGTPEGSALIGDLQSLIGSYENGALNPSSMVGMNGQTIGNLPWFVG